MQRHETRAPSSASGQGDLLLVPVAAVASALVATAFSTMSSRRSNSQMEVNANETEVNNEEQRGVSMEEFQGDFAKNEMAVEPPSGETDLSQEDETVVEEGDLAMNIEEADLPQEDETAEEETQSDLATNEMTVESLEEEADLPQDDETVEDEEEAEGDLVTNEMTVEFPEEEADLPQGDETVEEVEEETQGDLAMNETALEASEEEANLTHDDETVEEEAAQGAQDDEEAVQEEIDLAKNEIIVETHVEETALFQIDETVEEEAQVVDRSEPPVEETGRPVDDETTEAQVVPQEVDDEVHQLTVLESEEAPVPTWEEAAHQCKTRMPDDAGCVDCPCGTGLVYKECCAPYHEGKAPESPLKVLRSRYTAFSWRIIEHIIDTTHPDYVNAAFKEDKVEWVKDLDKVGMFDNHDFCALEPGLEEDVSESEAFVTFQVKMKAHDGDEERVIGERSKFLKGEDGRWMYATAEAAKKPDVPAPISSPPTIFISSPPVSSPPRTPRRKMSKAFSSFKTRKNRSPKSVKTNFSGASDSSSQAGVSDMSSVAGSVARSELSCVA